jgi:hypothetical protein
MRVRCALLFVMIAVFGAVPTDSCSFSEGPMFVFRRRPDAPIAAFISGRLGVLMPTYARSYLVVAWRHLAGKPLAEAETKGTLAYYTGRLGDNELPARPHRDPLEQWMEVRNTVIASDSRPSYYRAPQYFYIVNCTGDAFLTAAATLKSRIAEFGIGHPGVRDWVEAQNAVFSNCEQTGTAPSPATDALPAAFRLDRDYQIAAASFYGLEFDRAHEQFLAVSRDRASPWRRIARIVAARALIRKAMLSNREAVDSAVLTQADQELRAILADADMQGLHGAASELEDYVQLWLDPAARRAELGREIAGGRLTQHALTDYVALSDKDMPASDEMTDWITTFRPWARNEHRPPENAKVFAHAIERWESTHSLPWLVAAIAHASTGDTHLAEVLAAAANVPPSSPAFLTVAYHRARLLLDRGDAAIAKGELDRVLALPEGEMGMSARNSFRALRLPLADSLTTFVKDAVRLPAGTDMNAVADPPYEALFDADAAVVFNQALPLASLIEASRVEGLPDSIRAQLVAAAFTRAIVLGRTNIALQLVPEMHHQFDNEVNVKDRLNRFAAAPAGRRRIEALDLLLHVPGLSPFITPYEGRVNEKTPMTDLIHSFRHENWWCERGLDHGAVIYPQYVHSRAALHVPAFANAQPLRDAYAAEETDLGISGASFMLRGAMTWAKEYPDDAGVPEALSLAIRGTQWACPDAATKKLAASAFDVLHGRYGATTWAQQTRHWYDGRD